MKKAKQFLALFLCLIMTLAILSPITASAAVCACEDIPVIYIKGRSQIYMNKDDFTWDPVNGTQTSQYELPHADSDFIVSEVERILPIFLKCMTKNDYTE